MRIKVKQKLIFEWQESLIHMDQGIYIKIDLQYKYSCELLLYYICTIDCIMFYSLNNIICTMFT